MSINRISPSFFSGRWYHLRKLKEATDLAIHKYIKGESRGILLDFGCGDSPYKPLFEPFVSKYVGADIARNPQAEINIDPETGRVESPDQSFDYLLSTQVLEHVIAPNAYLKEAHRILKINGYLLLSTHGFWVYHPDPTDFWRWTRDGLEKTIEQGGFEIVETLGVCGQAASGLQLLQESLRKRFPGPLKKIWFALIAILQLTLDSGRLDQRDACVYLVIARKK